MKNHILKKFFAILVITAALPLNSYAMKFANQFVEFELPAQWQCSLEGAEWVCQSLDDARRRDAIIVLAAKIKGNQDSLDQYLTYLKGSKTYNSIQNKQIKSEPKYAKTVNLNGQAWVDALHLESEIPGFYTRYLATVKQDIGVLVTYSINKAKYQMYFQDFETLVRTLRVFRKQGGINVAPQNSNLFQNVQIPQGVSDSTVFPATNPQGAADAPKSQKKGEDIPLWMIIAGAAVVMYLIWRRKQKQAPPY